MDSDKVLHFIAEAHKHTHIHIHTHNHTSHSGSPHIFGPPVLHQYSNELSTFIFSYYVNQG